MLVFDQSEARYAYEKYAYNKKNMYCIIFNWNMYNINKGYRNNKFTYTGCFIKKGPKLKG